VDDDDLTQAKIDKEESDDTTPTKEIQKLNKHIGQIEGKVSEITKKYEELKKKDAQTKTKLRAVQSNSGSKSLKD
jgi:peptidoglycan hydrolase CwlO-like protein